VGDVVVVVAYAEEYHWKMQHLVAVIPVLVFVDVDHY
jgi:hypothetical protein